jgi:AbrB family looped-hinge helix DNA binding protein
MPTSKVTRKGQVTIPQDIRETLGIREGDTVQIVLENDRVMLRRIVPWAELAGSLGHLARLVPDDEAQLKELIEAAWTSEAVERLGGAERPAGEERPGGEGRPGGEVPQ